MKDHKLIAFLALVVSLILGFFIWTKVNDKNN